MRYSRSSPLLTLLNEAAAENLIKNETQFRRKFQSCVVWSQLYGEFGN
jgi:hypothetical protein